MNRNPSVSARFSKHPAYTPQVQADQSRAGIIRERFEGRISFEDALARIRAKNTPPRLNQIFHSVVLTDATVNVPQLLVPLNTSRMSLLIFTPDGGDIVGNEAWLAYGTPIIFGKFVLGSFIWGIPLPVSPVSPIPGGNASQSASGVVSVDDIWVTNSLPTGVSKIRVCAYEGTLAFGQEQAA